MCEKSSTINVGFCKGTFHPGTHMCLVFRTEEERKKIITKFIESGILDDERVSYFADSATPEDVIDWLSSLDVDISEALHEHNFSTDNAVDVYCPDGTFQPERMLNTLKESYTASEQAGYSNARVTGEMTWALKGLPGSERLIEYESKINEVVKTHPITAMCQYDANRFSGSLIYQAIQVHPFMVVNGQLVENPYFITRE